MFCLEEMKNGINVEKECSKCKVNYFIDKYKMNGCYNSDRYCTQISFSRDSVFEVSIFYCLECRINEKI